MDIINPYKGIDFDAIGRVLGVSHQHLSHTKAKTQGSYDSIYATGVRHFAISRYRPSIITYPFDYENNTFVYVANSFDSTSDVDTLKEEDGVTINMGSDVVGSPNAEHIYPLLLNDGKWSQWSSVHINAIGSTWESCTVPDPVDGYNNVSSGLTYSQDIAKMLENLQWPECGGVIINHLDYTNKTKHIDFDVVRFTADCLDFDPRVLGTDIIAAGSQGSFGYLSKCIDTILKTGRRCWVFAQGDWNMTRGRNELLIPTGLSRPEQEYAVLKAYRDGQFFGRYANTDLSIVGVDYVNGIFTLQALNADGIKVIIDGEETDYPGDNSVYVTVPDGSVYVRAFAYKNRDEDPNWTYKDTDVYKDIVFTNPIMLRPQTYPYDPAYDEKPDPGPQPPPEPPKPIRKPSRLWLWG